MRSGWLLLACWSGCAAATPERREAETVLWRSLGAPEVGERRCAVRMVAALGDPALDRHLPARLGDPDPTVRALAACALAPEVDAAVALCAAALEDADPDARLAALDAISALPDAAARVLERVRDADPRIRARAADRLAALHPPGARSLIDVLVTDADAGVRAAALGALTALGGRDALPAPVIERGLADPALSVRLAALHALAGLSDDPARMAALADGPDRFVALRAAVRLARRGHADRAQAAVRAAAADPRWELRAAAMNAAGELGAAGVALARSLVRDPAPQVRLAAAAALLRSDDAGALGAARAALLSALATPLRLEAAAELTRLGDARGRAALDAAAAAGAPALRLQAVSLLASVPHSTALLRRALADADATTRLTAAEALLRRALQPQLR